MGGSLLAGDRSIAKPRRKLTCEDATSQNGRGGTGMVDPAESLIVEPFGFFTREAPRAGWYLAWRQLIRVVPLAVGAILIGAALSHVGLGVVGTLAMGLCLCAASIWAALLVFRLAGQWAVVTYGYPLTGAVRVWWAITWRTSVAALVASVIVTPPQFVAVSLSASFPGS